MRRNMNVNYLVIMNLMTSKNMMKDIKSKLLFILMLVIENIKSLSSQVTLKITGINFMSTLC